MKAIPLTKGQVALVDDEDYERVSRLRWSADEARSKSGRIYWCASARLHGTRRKVKLHRFILDAPAGVDVDHINHNALDCRRENMRLATRQQNAANARKTIRRTTSTYKGVYWRHDPKYRSGGRWIAQIRTGNVYIRRLFKTEVAAAAAYNEMARHHYGAFACLNEAACDS